MFQSYQTRRIPVGNLRSSYSRAKTSLGPNKHISSIPNNTPRVIKTSLSPLDNLFEPARISKISNKLPPRKINSARSSRFASKETQQLFKSHSLLKETFREFSFDLTEKIFDCEFIRQFDRFETAFDCFSHQLAIVFSAVNPNNIIKNGSPMKTLALNRTAKDLMIEWVDFIQRLNTLSENGIAPHIQYINDCFTTLFSDLTKMSTLILTDTAKSDRANQIIKALCTVCLRIKESILSEFPKLKSERFKYFDRQLFDDQCQQASKLTVSLFEHNLPPNTFTINDVLALKSEITTTLSSLSLVLKCAINYDDQIMKLKRSIISFNNELNIVESKVNLPFIVELTLDEPVDLVGDFESFENESKQNENNQKDESNHDKEENNQSENIDKPNEEFFETKKKDEEKESSNETKETTANETKEETKTEINEQMTTESIEEKSNEAKDKTTNETKEETPNETIEEATTEFNEEKTNETKEETSNQSNEEITNETKENNANETKEETTNTNKVE